MEVVVAVGDSCCDADFAVRDRMMAGRAGSAQEPAARTAMEERRAVVGD